MKIPSDWNGLQLATRLRSLGYAITRQTGSHMRLTRMGAQGQQHLTIPAHRPLRVGTLRQILNTISDQCSIDLEELLRRLEG